MGDFGGNIVGGLVIFVVILVVTALICREIVCWYFKINENIALQVEIRDLMRKSSLRTDVQDRPSKSSGVSQSKNNGAAVELEEPMNEQQLMAKFGITFVAGKYAYSGYTYTHLKDAIDYASKNQ